jgi:hypothetical protein
MKPFMIVGGESDQSSFFVAVQSGEQENENATEQTSLTSSDDAQMWQSPKSQRRLVIRERSPSTTYGTEIVVDRESETISDSLIIPVRIAVPRGDIHNEGLSHTIGLDLKRTLTVRGPLPGTEKLN